MTGIIRNPPREDKIIISVTQEVLDALDVLGKNRYKNYDLNPVLLRGKKRKPIVQIRSLEETAIHTPTPEELDTLLQVLECGDLFWHGGALPTALDVFDKYLDKTTITRNDLSLTERGSYKEHYCKTFSPSKFYQMQDIKQEYILEINKWFKKYKPNRASKPK